MTEPLNNRHVIEVKELVTPRQIKEQLPITAAAEATVLQTRQASGTSSMDETNIGSSWSLGRAPFMTLKRPMPTGPHSKRWVRPPKTIC